MNIEITNQQLVSKLNLAINEFINSAKLNKKKITRDEIIEMLTARLSEIIEDNSEDKDKVLMTSGIAIGIAMVIQVELILSENKF